MERSISELSFRCRQYVYNGLEVYQFNYESQTSTLMKTRFNNSGRLVTTEIRHFSPGWTCPMLTSHRRYFSPCFHEYAELRLTSYNNDHKIRPEQLISADCLLKSLLYYAEQVFSCIWTAGFITLLRPTFRTSAILNKFILLLFLLTCKHLQRAAVVSSAENLKFFWKPAAQPWSYFSKYALNHVLQVSSFSYWTSLFSFAATSRKNAVWRPFKHLYYSISVLFSN